MVEATTTQVALSNVLLAIFVLIMAPFGIAFTFFMYKNIQPVKARSAILISGTLFNIISIQRRKSTVHWMYLFICLSTSSSD